MSSPLSAIAIRKIRIRQKKLVKGIGGLAFLLFGLAAIIRFQIDQQTLDLRASNSGVEDCELHNCTHLDLAKNSQQFVRHTSPTGNYSVVFDASEWSIKSPRETETHLILRNQVGFIFAKLTAEHNSVLDEQFFRDLVDTPKADKVTDFSATSISGEKTYVKKITTPSLGSIGEYLVYYFPHDKGFLRVEIRATSIIAMNQKIEELLKGLELGSSPQKVLGTSTAKVFSDVEVVELVKPSVGNILHIYCKTIRINKENALFLNKEYPYCAGNYGSGFIVSSDGLVATNGHVVTNHKEGDLISGVLKNKASVRPFVNDFLNETLVKRSTLSADEVLSDPIASDMLIRKIYDAFEAGEIEVATTQERFFVNFGREPYTFNEDILTEDGMKSIAFDSETIIEARLAAVDYLNNYEKEVILDNKKPTGSDVALLQLQQDSFYDFPPLQLGKAESLKEGQQILILGFPSLVSGEDANSIIDYHLSSTKVTVTRGIVSSIKRDNESRYLIQTDASVEHGNSGGPAITTDGKVIGIATYGLESQAGNYNLLRDAYDLKTLADKTGLVINQNSQTFEYWLSGLTYYWQQKFTRSLPYFTKVLETYPIHPEAERKIQEIEQAIELGQDRNMIFGIDVYLFALILLFAFVLIAFIWAIVLYMRYSLLSKDLESTYQYIKN